MYVHFQNLYVQIRNSFGQNRKNKKWPKAELKTAHNIGMITQIRKYPARCKSEDKNVAINMVHTAKNRKYMHIEFSINVIQTAKYRKYMHI